MSEVIWYYDEAEGGGVQKVAGLGSYIKAEDFHDMEADRDAQRLRADTAEAELSKLRDSSAIAGRHLDRMIEHSDSLEVKLTAAEQRIAELSDLLRKVGGDSALWLSEFGEPSDGGYRAAFTEIDAALNQKSEGESQ